MRRIVTRPRCAALGGTAVLAVLLALALAAGCGASGSSKASPAASGGPGSPAAAVTYPPTASPATSGSPSVGTGPTSPGTTVAPSASPSATAGLTPGTAADLGLAEVRAQSFFSALAAGDKTAAAAAVANGGAVPRASTMLHGVKKFAVVSMTNDGQYFSTQATVKIVVLVDPRSGSGPTPFGWTKGNNTVIVKLTRPDTNHGFKIVSFQKL